MLDSRKPFDMRGITLALVAAVFLLQSGCATYAHRAGSMHGHLKAGRIAQAAKLAEKEDRRETEVLASLNKGMLRRMQKDFTGSNRIFEKAKKQIEELYGVSISEQLGATTINDTLRKFKGDRFEQVLLHAYMAMNYIEKGDPDSARVEMLQADVKMKEWGEQPDEDPFMRYFSGLVYEMLGDTDDAIIAYRRAVTLYKDAASKQARIVPKQLKKDLLNLLYREGRDDEFDQYRREFDMSNYRPVERGTGDVVVLLSQGLAPVRSEKAIQTFATELENMVRIALPRYRGSAQKLDRARVRTASVSRDFEIVEDVDALARHALEEEMPTIMTRAIARAVIKHKAHEKAEEKDGLAGFLTKVAAIASERADTRSWTTLPQQIRLARIQLSPGTHELNIDIVNAADRTIDSMKRDVSIRKGDLKLISQHWIAPVPVKKNKSNKQQASK